MAADNSRYITVFFCFFSAKFRRNFLLLFSYASTILFLAMSGFFLGLGRRLQVWYFISLGRCHLNAMPFGIEWWCRIIVSKRIAPFHQILPFFFAAVPIILTRKPLLGILRLPAFYESAHYDSNIYDRITALLILLLCRVLISWMDMKTNGAKNLPPAAHPVGPPPGRGGRGEAFGSRLPPPLKWYS